VALVCLLLVTLAALVCARPYGTCEDDQINVTSNNNAGYECKDCDERAGDCDDASECFVKCTGERNRGACARCPILPTGSDCVTDTVNYGNCSWKCSGGSDFISLANEPGGGQCLKQVVLPRVRCYTTSPATPPQLLVPASDTRVLLLRIGYMIAGECRSEPGSTWNERSWRGARPFPASFLSRASHAGLQRGLLHRERFGLICSILSSVRLRCGDLPPEQVILALFLERLDINVLIERQSILHDRLKNLIVPSKYGAAHPVFGGAADDGEWLFWSDSDRNYSQLS
jgi:hypothetical protein